MRERALADPSEILVRIGLAQHVGLFEGQAGGDVAVQRIVRGGLVGDHVDLDATADELGQDLGGVAGEADRERAPLAASRVETVERVVEISRPLVEIPGLDAPLDPLQIHFDAQRRPAEHRDRQRLRAAHAAQTGGDHQPPGQRPVEALARSGGERLVSALEDPLRADVDPRPGGHLPVHHQPGCVELPELVPVGPVRDQVRVRDQHARGGLVGLEHRHRLARLDEQRLLVAEALELADDRVVAGPVARGLADAAVDDELRGLLGDVGMQVVLEHAQRRLLLPALAPQGGERWRAHAAAAPGAPRLRDSSAAWPATARPHVWIRRRDTR